ncbi:MAG: hypothetical protein H6737_29480 [Alphaproteobacteria bacterium]|nr:hypothetical protein [Alphaproteobacteria bacterium]
MSDDPFAAPESDFDDTVRNRARNNLYMTAASAVGLGFLQFCCNPCYMVTIAAAASGVNAIRQPRWLEISLEEDYPQDAGTVSKVAGYIAIGLVALRILLEVVVTALVIAGEI